MSSNPEKVVLYAQGTFSLKNPNWKQKAKMLEEAADIRASGFGTVILGQWHVQGGAALHWNTSSIDETGWALENIPQTLKTGGTVKNVLLTFGPGATDYKNIADNLKKFKSEILRLHHDNDIDGLDWDFEGPSYSEYTNLLIELTTWAKSEGMIVTAAPYKDQDFWLKVLANTNSRIEAVIDTGFSWWNLQTYALANYSTWVGYLKGYVPYPESFLVPGYTVDEHSPNGVEGKVAGLEKNHNKLDGAYIWNYGKIIAPRHTHTAKEYAKAILAGLKASSAAEASLID